MGTVSSEIRKALAEIINKDVSHAGTLPPAYYTSEEFLELEREEIFRKEWICLGRVDEIPRPGDYFTTELIDEPLIVVRGQDDRIRVLSNVCRHRSSVILEGVGNAKNFVCPYHAWTYSNDGQLLRAPYMDQVKGFEVRNCRLPEFATEFWHGFIYVNLDGKAKPLAPRLKGLEPYIKNYHAAQMTHQFVYQDTWNTNWKCLTENFMEGYHLSVTHPNSLHSITPTRLCEKFPGGEGYTGFLSHYDPDFPQRTPYHTDVTELEKRYSVMFCVYPSHVVGLTPNGVIYMCLRPPSANQVTTRWGYASFDPKPSRKAVKVALDLYHAINREDREKLEELQRGLRSRFVTTSQLGPPDLEGTVWDISQYVAGRLV